MSSFAVRITLWITSIKAFVAMSPLSKAIRPSVKYFVGIGSKPIVYPPFLPFLIWGVFIEVTLTRERALNPGPIDFLKNRI